MIEPGPYVSLFDKRRCVLWIVAARETTDGATMFAYFYKYLDSGNPRPDVSIVTMGDKAFYDSWRKRD